MHIIFIQHFQVFTVYAIKMNQKYDLLASKYIEYYDDKLNALQHMHNTKNVQNLKSVTVNAFDLKAKQIIYVFTKQSTNFGICKIQSVG